MLKVKPFFRGSLAPRKDDIVIQDSNITHVWEWYVKAMVRRGFTIHTMSRVEYDDTIQFFSQDIREFYHHIIISNDPMEIMKLSQEDCCNVLFVYTA